MERFDWQVDAKHRILTERVAWDFARVQQDILALIPGYGGYDHVGNYYPLWRSPFPLNFGCPQLEVCFHAQVA